MGTWGTAISSNDTYADIFGSFFELYNDGVEVSEISKKLIADNQDLINDKEDCNNFWFAIAKAQWECKELEKGLLEKIEQIIISNSDIEIWKQLDSSEKDIKKRKIVLDKFLEKLHTKKPKARKRKKKIIRKPVFEKGDCLTFKLENGNYGGAIALEAIYETEYGHNLIATTRINQVVKPSIENFENSELLILNYDNWDLKECINWYLPIRHKKISHLIEVVGKSNIQTEFDINQSMLGHVADFEIWVIELANKQFKSEETKPKPSKSKTIKSIVQKSVKRKSKWKLW
ncbi:MAG: hypothetical protein COA58_13120 [Bacteroidetes bacterium]|nr:MAG: hypothetical protein COA58_13120 [Bacteroidota bacterium]